MATSRKRPSTGFTAKPETEVEEKVEVEEFLEPIAEETLQQTKEEEVQEVELEIKVEPIREIVPTEDLGPRFVEQPVVEAKEPAKLAEPKRPRPHPRNTPRFSRVAK
jgi:hypothetical protein